MDEERERERKQEIVVVQRCLWWMFEVNVGLEWNVRLIHVILREKRDFIASFIYFTIFCEMMRILNG